MLGSAPGHSRVLEFLPWIKELDRQLVDIDRVARWCGAAGVASTWNQLAENGRDPSRAERILEQAHALHADGCRVYGQVSPRPFDLQRELRPDAGVRGRSLRGAGSSRCRPPTRSGALLADPAWRAAARADWDRIGDGFTIFPVSRLDRVRLTSVRDGEEQFLDRSFADVVATRGGHPSDVLADWVLEHDLAPGMVAEALSNNDAEQGERAHRRPDHRGRRQRRRRASADDVRRGRLDAAAHRARARPRRPHRRGTACTR